MIRSKKDYLYLQSTIGFRFSISWLSDYDLFNPTIMRTLGIFKVVMPFSFCK